MIWSFGFTLLVIVLLESIIVMLPAIARMYQMPFVGEFINAMPGNALWENNIKIVRSYDRIKAGKEHVSEVTWTLCIKGSRAFRPLISILLVIQN